MSNKLTGQQEKFCSCIADGLNNSDSYRLAYPRSNKWKNKTVNEAASRLFGKVSTRVDELKAELAKKKLWTREKSVKALSRIAEESREIDGVCWFSKDCDVIAAVKELNSMHGYKEAEVHDHKSSDGSMTPATPNLDWLAEIINKTNKLD